MRKSKKRRKTRTPIQKRPHNKKCMCQNQSLTKELREVLVKYCKHQHNTYPIDFANRTEAKFTNDPRLQRKNKEGTQRLTKNGHRIVIEMIKFLAKHNVKFKNRDYQLDQFKGYEAKIERTRRVVPIRNPVKLTPEQKKQREMFKRLQNGGTLTQEEKEALEQGTLH
jgi:hypothetical protein